MISEKVGGRLRKKKQREEEMWKIERSGTNSKKMWTQKRA